MLVQDFLMRAAAHRPECIALVCGAQRYTFFDLNRRANCVAHALVASGVKRGDRVAIFLPNCVEAVIAIFGVLKAGAVFVMINPTTKAEKLAYILADCQAAALIAEIRPDGTTTIDGLPDLPSLRTKLFRERGNRAANSLSTVSTFSNIQGAFAENEPCRQNIDLDLACLIYTSGSTGEPKGVMCDHSNVVFVTESIVEYLENNERDVMLSVLPLSFSYGLYQLMASVRCGATLVLEESFAFPAAVLKRMTADRVTGFAGVPTIYAILLGMDLKAFDLSSLRYMTNAAAALPVEHIRRIREKFPTVALYLMHGLTEVARTVFLPPQQVDRRPSSVGKAIPGTEIWLEDEQGRRTRAGEVGEMVVRGRNVMRGYWNNPEATRERFRPGGIPGERLCYTGDLFRTDEEGFHYFVARKDDIIKCRGEKVSPREIENVLYAIDGVTEAAVIGVADPVFGQAIKAFIVAPERQLTVAQVLAHCKAHLEDLMIPKHVEFRMELPKTGSGKIRKLELQ